MEHLSNDQPKTSVDTQDPQFGPMDSAPHDDRRELAEFVQRLFKQTPRIRVIPLLILANLVMMIFLVRDGVDAIWPGRDPQNMHRQAMLLIDWGANYAPKTADGEWWRLASALFLHAGFIHFGMNMLTLYGVGAFVERFCGHVGFALLYLGTGLCGSLASVYWHDDVPSVGASGAIFGIVGVFLACAWRQRKVWPKRLRRSARMLAFQCIGLLAIFQFAPGLRDLVDNAGHLGGFFSGIVGGLIICQPVGQVTRWSRAIRNLIIVLATAGTVAVGITQYPGPMIDFPAEYQRIGEFEKDADREIQSIEDRLQAGAINGIEAAEEYKNDVLPIFETIRSRLNAPERIPASKQRLWDGLKTVFELRFLATQKRIQYLETGNDDHHFESVRLYEEANNLLRSIQPKPN
ncbi:rhomboid family intramembrane serine protease [Thalassoroseus pseudoceratinae]|uniref:rhomboid family intramembrane serine protease n=1 Tax=Thalassoroseus pseudoceratinae TaxID=2713176 RepID=UPI0014243131|nr:rhomboid family intramembrane serine protease [Thalassoroseus pseudoceratinae]